MEEQLPPEEEDPIDITIRSVEDIINDFLSN
jgi:penicillin-binding protein 1A